MLFLLLAILCTSSIALLFKVSETRGMNRYALTSANYATACLISGTLLAVLGVPGLDGDLAAGWRDLGAALANDSPNGVAASVMPLWAGVVGLAAGVLFFLGFLYYQLSVREHGAGIAGATIKLGILVPLALSLIVWRESPSTWAWAGMTLAVGSLALLNVPVLIRGWRRREPVAAAHAAGVAGSTVAVPTAGPPEGANARPKRREAGTWTLLLLFVFGGLAEFSNKVFETYGLLGADTTRDQLRGSLVFLFVTFFVALLLSLIWTARKRLPISRRDLALGALVGIPNLFSSAFLILALDTIPAAAAFPAFGAGSIVLINLTSVAFLGERLRIHEWVAIALTIFALVLLNIG